MQRVSVEAGQSRYQVTKQELNALGQTVSSTSYATAVALSDVQRGSDRRCRRRRRPVEGQASRASSTTSPAARSTVCKRSQSKRRQRKYRVSAQRFDAFGRVVQHHDYATAVALNAFDKASIDAAVHAVADATKDRVSAVAYDAWTR